MIDTIQNPSGPPALLRRALDVLWWGMLAGIAGVLTIHFAFVTIANLPVSPLRAEFRNQIEYWVHPWFSQNWSFFAPEPVNEDIDLLVRGRYAENGSAQTTTWFDVNQPLIAEVARNRFSSLFVVEMTLSNLLNTYDNELKKDSRAILVRNGKRRPRLSLSTAIDPYDEQMLGRFGSSVLGIRYPGRHFTEFQIAIAHHHFARFNERHTHKGEVWYAQRVAWQRFTPVATFCCTHKVIPQ